MEITHIQRTRLLFYSHRGQPLRNVPLVIRSSDYQGWLNQSRKQQDHGFLWIKGNHSAGKSTIMKFVYSEQVLRASSDETVMAFFFNARGGPMERSPKGMYRSLLHQLLGSDSLPQLRPIFHDSALKPHVRLQLAQTYEQIFSNNPSPT